MITERIAKEISERMENSQDFAIAIVTHTEGETSVKAGSYAIVLPNGNIDGWIGGSCLRPEVAKYGMQSLRDGIPRVLRFGPDKVFMTSGNVVEMPMACVSGGSIEVFIDPFLAKMKVVVIGNSPAALAISRLCEMIGYKSEIIGSKPEVYGREDAPSIFKEIDEFQQDLRTAFVVATHQAMEGISDVDIARRLVRKDPFYIGIVTSHRRAAALRKELRKLGLSDERIGTIRAPAGISLGKDLSPEEIALSVVSEIVGLHKGGTFGQIQGRHPSITEESPEYERDPVCGMSVVSGQSELRFQWEGKTYLFCSRACLESFSADPDKYLHLQN
ncbi:XdhC family protein [Thermoplasmatales archaeon AK]|nr:XdhC family protein [Thermoplasmatales archaeon AK]